MSVAHSVTTDELESSLEFARYEREQVQSSLLALWRKGEKIPASLERELRHLDNEIATLKVSLFGVAC